MRWNVVEINAKFLLQSETDPEELPADIYSHIAEFLPSLDHLMDLEVETFALPEDVHGTLDRRNASDSEEAK